MKNQAGVHFYKAKKYGERAALWLRPYHPAAEELRNITGLILSTENLKELVRLTNEELVETGNLPASLELARSARSENAGPLEQ